MTNANLTNVLVTDEQLAAVITEQLPRLLEARPAVRRNLRRTLIQFLDEEGLLERFERKIEEPGQDTSAVDSADSTVRRRKQAALDQEPNRRRKQAALV